VEDPEGFDVVAGRCLVKTIREGSDGFAANTGYGRISAVGRQAHPSAPVAE